MMIDEQLERRRRKAADRWDLEGQLVLVAAGEPVPVPGRGDRTYPFHAHSEYLYLTDLERPGGVLAFDPDDGWLHFVRPVTRDERLWEGAAGDGPDGVPVSELAGWLAGRRGRPIANLGEPLGAIDSDAALVDRLRADLNAVRRRKDAVELERMRAAERATRAGFDAAAPLIAPGRSEREVQIELEAAFLRAGADALAFDTIVAGGPSSAVLHFPPTPRRFADGDLVLIDAGAEVRGYGSDVTRTYPAAAAFSAEQQAICEIVEAACERGVDLCRAGVEWRDVHRAAALVIADGLVAFGLLRGDPERLVERGSQSLFFPHGVGHMVGLGVRDAGEALPGREPTDDLVRLRVDLPLEPGYVMTVEPGIYLVPALLRDPDLRERHRDAVDWERAERMLAFGGVRIEQNVLVTDGEPEVLTADIPLGLPR